VIIWRIKRILLVLAFPLLTALAGCFQAAEQQPSPGLSPALEVPTLAQAIVLPTETNTPVVTDTPTPTFTPIPPSKTPFPTPFNLLTPLATGEAVDPSSIRATSTPPQSAATANPELELEKVEWRPPPMQVPLAIHPDDHYWLARPIPSGKRNYDLPWFPYGNDVLIPQFAPYRIHHGVDFPNPPGTTVLAAGNGTVVWAGPRPSPRNGINYYGNTIIIQHDWQWEGKDVFTLYAHTLEMFVTVGENVRQGQLLAGVGQSGQVSGSHLHFEVRVGENQYWSSQNPSLWMAPYEGWGTLAGRFVDRQGIMIPNAKITVFPLNTTFDTEIRNQRTYMDQNLQPDEVWNENFVVNDLPAGRYEVLVLIESEPGLEQKYVEQIEVLPGRTNFLLVQADFIYVAPTPTPVITSTVGISETIGITSTVPITDTVPDAEE
jgi:murein DD-endopeptidase MepM/ murein hydrolase activator NlpD